MAENKLSWTELRRALAKRAGVSEKTAGTFLNSFAAQLVEALKQDKQVKINGLGTFKLQAVAPRKSVNVKTGEEIVIEGYNKVVFAPEVGMKEIVEGGKRKAENEKEESENVAGIDPLKKLGEQAEEIVGILAEIEQTKPEVEEEPVVEAPVEEEPVVKEPEPVVVPEPEPVVSPKPKKKYHFLRDTLICVVILLMLLLCGYFFLRTHISEWIDSLFQPNPQTEVVVENDTVPSIIEEPIVEEPVAEETMVEEPQEEPYSELLTTEYITPGSRLTWIAKKYYGSKIYWPYIYEANKKEIPNPSKIAIGTPVRVPKLTKSQLDTVGSENRARLEKLRVEAEEACRK
jgi:nucleoid DNA-binding protein